MCVYALAPAISFWSMERSWDFSYKIRIYSISVVCVCTSCLEFKSNIFCKVNLLILRTQLLPRKRTTFFTKKKVFRRNVQQSNQILSQLRIRIWKMLDLVLVKVKYTYIGPLLTCKSKAKSLIIWLPKSFTSSLKESGNFDQRR